MESKNSCKIKKYFSLSLEKREEEELSFYLKRTGNDFESYMKSLVLKDWMLSKEKKIKNNLKKGD